MDFKAKKILIALSPLLLIFGIAAGIVYGVLGTSFATTDDEHIIFITENTPADSVRHHVESVSKGLKLRIFNYLTKRDDYYNNLRPGRYDIGSGTSTIEVYRNLRSGNETPVKVNIPFLHNISEVSRHLGKKFMADSADFERVLTNEELLSKYGLKRETAICLFMQETYEFYWTITPEKFLERMAKEYDRYWTDSRRKKLNRVHEGFSREEAITLASIVECETNNKDEKPTIAGLYINRLHKGMKLQTDPTVKYAVGDFTIRRVLNKHLTTESPYNTYLHEGLPPGPICTVSPASIKAVLEYEQNDYLFMCAKEDFSGTHNFAATDVEHAANAKRYQQALDARKIKK